MSAPDRAAWIAAFRAVLDVADQASEGVPVPDLTSHAGITWHIFTPDAARDIAAIEAAFPCELTGAIDPKDAKYYQLTGSLHGVPVVISGRAADLAERKVTGTTVTEVVEWVRKPVNSDEGEME